MLENPKTAEYQIVRTSLFPGLLKTVRENRKHTLPLRIFEVSDIAIKDATVERRARNVRKAAALFCGRKAGFEIVHGLLDRLMLMLEITNIKSRQGKTQDGKAGYWIEQFDGKQMWLITSSSGSDDILDIDPTFFPDRAAKIYYRPPTDSSTQSAHLLETGANRDNDLSTSSSEPASSSQADGKPTDVASKQSTQTSASSALDSLKDKLLSALPTTSSSKTPKQKDREIGIMGILHPTVLQHFDIEYPCSAIEFTVEGL